MDDLGEFSWETIFDTFRRLMGDALRSRSWRMVIYILLTIDLTILLIVWKYMRRMWNAEYDTKKFEKVLGQLYSWSYLLSMLVSGCVNLVGKNYIIGVLTFALGVYSWQRWAKEVVRIRIERPNVIRLFVLPDADSAFQRLTTVCTSLIFSVPFWFKFIFNKQLSGFTPIILMTCSFSIGFFFNATFNYVTSIPLPDEPPEQRKRQPFSLREIGELFGKGWITPPPMPS